MCSIFSDTGWDGDLANMQLISKCNKGIQFLSCVIDVFIYYMWVAPLKDKKGITITYEFQTILDKFSHKLNRTWVDKGSEFYNRSMKT